MSVNFEAWPEGCEQCNIETFTFVTTQDILQIYLTQLETTSNKC